MGRERGVVVRDRNGNSLRMSETFAVVDLTRGVRCRVESSSLSRPERVSALRVLPFRFPHTVPFLRPFLSSQTLRMPGPR